MRARPWARSTSSWVAPRSSRHPRSPPFLRPRPRPDFHRVDPVGRDRVRLHRARRLRDARPAFLRLASPPRVERPALLGCANPRHPRRESKTRGRLRARNLLRSHLRGWPLPLGARTPRGAPRVPYNATEAACAERRLEVGGHIDLQRLRVCNEVCPYLVGMTAHRAILDVRRVKSTTHIRRRIHQVPAVRAAVPDRILKSPIPPFHAAIVAPTAIRRAVDRRLVRDNQHLSCAAESDVLGAVFLGELGTKRGAKDASVTARPTTSAGSHVRLRTSVGALIRVSAERT